MKTGTFITEVNADGKISIPPEIRDRLNLAEGDKVEILLKKIRSKRFEVNIRKNPLHKILVLAEQKDIWRIMMKIFIDASGWYSIIDSNQENHEIAKDYFQQLLDTRVKLYSNILEINQVISFLKLILGVDE